MPKEFGLIGFPLTHSFSREYFLRKFSKENIDYQLFSLKKIEELPFLIASHPFLEGLNVTHPYKTALLPLLDEVSEDAHQIGAVNVIKIDRTALQPRLIGFNTDIFGFERTYLPYRQKYHRALILGTGGAAKAVVYVLEKLGISYQLVSRTPNKQKLSYENLTTEIVATHTLLINATPVGMAPHCDTKPIFPYEALTPQHLLIDLIYNPEETLFLKEGKRKGTQIKNGKDMFDIQAQESWKIWNLVH